MNKAYIAPTLHKTDNVLGELMSKLDYNLKYEIVFKWMPRPEYLDELKQLFDFIETLVGDKINERGN